MRLIDADELKDKLETFVLYRGNAFFEVTDMLHKVDECKTIGDDHQKRGKWTCIAGKHATWECSNCHRRFDYPSLYCPACGSKMRSLRANFQEGENHGND